MDAIDTLQIPPVQHYSGEDPYPGLALFAVVQELDGDEATSDAWPIDFDIFPVVDGVANWDSRKIFNQGVEGGLQLNTFLDFELIDNDGSEEPILATFNFSNLIDDAGIANTLAALDGTDTGLTKLVNNYLSGTFNYSEADGTITAFIGDISGMILSEDLFAFSNQDFELPLTVLIRDSALINGELVFDEAVLPETILVDLVGVAEVPSVFAEDAIGESLTRIPVTLGGESNDIDAQLGRESSETVYFIVTDIVATGMPFDYVVRKKSCRSTFVLTTNTLDLIQICGSS